MSKKETISLIKLLSKELIIPNYQRPYEWNKSNVYVLLDDINNNYINNKEINLGTIILYKNKDSLFEIVDGQQRLITLSLLLKILDDNCEIKLLDKKILCISNTENRIISNYKSIYEFVDRMKTYENLNTNKFYKYLRDNVKFYVLESKDLNETFQLFYGRNSKYKDLTAVDLLKAYHLGELPKNYPIVNKRKILRDWNTFIKEPFSIDKSCNKIEYLYNNVLFNIYNWSLNDDIRTFTKNDIYLYKGYKGNDNYTYVKYYKNNNFYQINKPFKAGEDFFRMTSKYIKELDNIIENHNLKKKLNLNDDEYNYNFRYINYLYYNGLFAFYDRFGKNISCFYKDAIEDFIYKYSVLLRVKNKLVNLQSLNHYVLNTKYNFFFECNNALKVEELLKLELENIGNRPNKSEKLGEMRNKLWKELN